MVAPPLQVLQLAIIVGCPILSSVFVLLRIYARRKANIRLGSDDWTVIVACVLSFALIPPSWQHVLMWYLGYHVYEIPCCVFQPDLRKYYILLITTNLINIPIVPLVKVSIILLLMRAVSLISWLKKTLYCILIFTVGCALFPWILYIFVCPPTSGNIWAPRTFGGLRCLSRDQQGEMLIFTTCANLFTDVLILPIPFIIARRMMSATVRARLILLAVFLCGLAVTGIGAAKIYVSVDDRLFAKVKADWTHNINYVMSHIENCVAIIMANIPVLRGLITQWFPTLRGQPDSYQDRGDRSGSTLSADAKPNIFVRKLFPGIRDKFHIEMAVRREDSLLTSPSPVARRDGGSITGPELSIGSPLSYTFSGHFEKSDEIELVRGPKI
ncbi:hypothetical protein IQ07DRAFT_565608 [Pyrenochaeta sp. DS3sAY3a]|nr:hypothetical protein IQ07DRAFT_565608 [Pyrenochaeta sp. DS3sAY3a]